MMTPLGIYTLESGIDGGGNKRGVGLGVGGGGKFGPN